MKRLLGILLLSLPFTSLAQNDVTFIVDMTQYSGSTANGVFVNGNFNGWCGTCNPMSDPEGDSIWTVTLPLPATTNSIEWKFTVDGWTDDEIFTPGDPCTITDPSGQYTNRFATITGDTILPGYAWEDCSGVAGKVYMTFQVNMSYTAVDPTGVFLAGGTGFGVPGDNQMYPIGDSVYSKTLRANTGFYSMFTFLSANDPSWGAKENIVGKPCAAGQYSDRDMVGYSATNGLMSDFHYRTCFGECTTDGTCPMPATPVNVTFQSDRSNSPPFTTAYISGTMNGWSGDANQMTDADGDGVYDVILSLLPGSYEFKYTADSWAIAENFDPTTADSICTLTTGGFTNRFITIGNADTTLPVHPWEECASLGYTATACGDLYISEYSEGSSSNKYYEIYNPTGSPVSLAGYSVSVFSNGSSTAGNTITFPASATIAANDVYVVANASADPTILAFADTTSTTTYYNGDDALVLFKGTDTLDIIGVVGVDPGSEWTVGTGSTKEHTLVRMASVSQGTSDWTQSANEWDVYPQNTWTYGGAHTSNCAGSNPPSPSFTTVDINTFNGLDANGVADSIGTMKWIKVIVTSIDFDGNGGYNFTAEDGTDGITIYKSTVDVSGYNNPAMGDSIYVHGTVAQFNGLTELVPDSIYLVGSGYTLPSPTVTATLDESTESELIQMIGMTLSNPAQWPAAGSSASVDITDGTNTFTMRIDSDSDVDGSTAPSGMFDITGVGGQYDNSSPYDGGYQILPRMITDIYEYPVIPTYQISDVTGVDAMGLPDSANVLCKLEGIVMGVDMQGSPSAISFTLHDGVDGIGTYGSISNYTVTEGDSVRIIGSIGQYNGLLQMYLDSVVLISSGNALPTTPSLITSLDETTESELVKFENATLVDPTQWGSGSSGYTCEITNGSDTITLRIDADTDLYGTPAPVGAFDVVGIGGQFTFNSPALDGYQILPRYTADITPAAAVYVPKIVVSEIMAGSNSTNYNSDWFEIYNYGDSVVNIGGFSWDDESGISGTSVFPSVTISPGEAIVVLNDSSTNKDAFLAEWKLYPGSVTIVANDELTGSFPSLSQNGDGVYLYDASGAALTNSLYSAATAGYSVEFDTTGAFTGDAVDGTNGAYTSLEGDVGSPGNLTPNSNVNEQSIVRNIYPNPTTGMFTVELGVELEYTVQIVNMVGETIAVEQGLGNAVRMDLNAAAGTYLVKVVTDRGTQTLRVVLQ